MPELRFHELRYSFTTRALQNGVDIKTVPRKLSHFFSRIYAWIPMPSHYGGAKGGSGDNRSCVGDNKERRRPPLRRTFLDGLFGMGQV